MIDVTINDLKAINRLHVTNNRLLSFGFEILSESDKEFLSEVKPSKLMQVEPQGMKMWEINAICSADDLTEREKAKMVVELNQYGLVSKTELNNAYEVLLGKR